MLEGAVILESTLTYPHCGTAKTETMPTNACLFFYECTGCKVLLRPKPGDCCVFCSFGTVPCPPIQADSASPPAHGYAQPAPNAWASVRGEWRRARRAEDIARWRAETRLRGRRPRSKVGGPPPRPRAPGSRGRQGPVVTIPGTEQGPAHRRSRPPQPVRGKPCFVTACGGRPLHRLTSRC